MEPIQSLLGNLVGPKCASFILKFELKQIDCFKLLISKCLSFGIVGGAVLVKIPQIYNIISNNSVQGLSFLSNLLETVAIMISLSYNYRQGNPFSTYGETAFITIQNTIILLLIMIYHRNSLGAILVILGLFSFGSALLNPMIISPTFISTLQFGTIFIGISSKMPQILSNFKAKSTGQLSVITTFLQFAGSGIMKLTSRSYFNYSSRST
jgi:hypothetical protein